MTTPNQKGVGLWQRMLASPLWFKGVVVGVAVWLMAFLVCHSLAKIQSVFPDWIFSFGIVDFLRSACGVITYPIILGGWFFLWGDHGPPYDWMNSVWINAGIGIAICAGFGGLAAALIGRMARSKGSG